jgi:hypothetical protein
MPSRKAATEERLHEVVALGKAGRPPSSLELRPYLGDRSGIVAAAAARLAGEHGLAELQPELEAAFSRFSRDPVKTDPGCRAKLAIAEALRRLEAHAFDVFLHGVVLKQPEPVYGRPLDTAAPLRVCCASALLEARHSLALLHAAPLLADPEPTARAGIAAVLGGIGGETCEALLRLKVLAGDTEPGVTGACLQGLLSASVDRELSFVVEAMRSSDEDVVRLGLLGLGESRDPRALPALFEYATTAVDGDVRATALLALALSRLPEARAFLDEIVATGSPSRAREAREALDALRGSGE